jgi:hypothetical protein
MKGKRSKVASFTHTPIYSEFTIIGRLMLEPFSLYILSFLFYLIFHIPPPSPSVFLNIFFFQCGRPLRDLSSMYGRLFLPLHIFSQRFAKCCFDAMIVHRNISVPSNDSNDLITILHILC